MSFNPIFSLFRSIYLSLTGRIQFPRNRIGEIITAHDGMQFIIFRQVIVGSAKGQPCKPGARFQVRFRITRMTPKQNEIFSLVPILFITGLPGFRSKLWMNDRSEGWCQGLYEWETVQAAEKYANSFAMRFMTKRAEPGSISYRIN